MNTLILWVLKLLGGVTAAQWKIALDLVVTAAEAQLTSTAKRQWVVDNLGNSGVTGWLANLLTEMAHAYALKKGLL